MQSVHLRVIIFFCLVGIKSSFTIAKSNMAAFKKFFTKLLPTAWWKVCLLGVAVSGCGSDNHIDRHNHTHNLAAVNLQEGGEGKLT